MFFLCHNPNLRDMSIIHITHITEIHTQVDASLGVYHDTPARGMSMLSRPVIYLDVALLSCPTHNKTHTD